MSYGSRLEKLTNEERQVLSEALKKAESIPYSEMKKNLEKTSLYCLFDYEVEGIGGVVADCHYDGEPPAIRVGVTLTKPGLLSFMFPAGMDTIIYPPDQQQ